MEGRIQWPTVEIGDTVRRRIQCGQKLDEIGKFEGKVVYIHPERRFHTVEFLINSHVMRQSYHGDYDIDDWLKIPFLDELSGKSIPLESELE